MGRSHDALNPRTLAVIGCGRNHAKSHGFLDLGTKRIERRYCLTGEVSVPIPVPIPSPNGPKTDFLKSFAGSCDFRNSPFGQYSVE